MAELDPLPHVACTLAITPTAWDVMSRLILIAALLATLVACATRYGPGWQGSAATPFDTARRDCEAQAVRQMAKMPRDVAFETCMAGQGWRRH